MGEKNFGRVWCEIQKFMGNDDKAFDGGKPIVFTFHDPYSSEESQMDVLKSFLKQFTGSETLPIDLYPLTRLFYTLRNELAARGRVDKVPSEQFCETFLSNDPYETHGGISCKVIWSFFFFFIFQPFPIRVLIDLLIAAPWRHRCHTLLCAKSYSSLVIYIGRSFLRTIECWAHCRCAFASRCCCARNFGFHEKWIGRRNVGKSNRTHSAEQQFLLNFNYNFHIDDDDDDRLRKNRKMWLQNVMARKIGSRMWPVAHHVCQWTQMVRWTRFVLIYEIPFQRWIAKRNRCEHQRQPAMRPAMLNGKDDQCVHRWLVQTFKTNRIRAHSTILKWEFCATKTLI